MPIVTFKNYIDHFNKRGVLYGLFRIGKKNKEVIFRPHSDNIPLPFIKNGEAMVSFGTLGDMKSPAKLSSEDITTIINLGEGGYHQNEKYIIRRYTAAEIRTIDDYITGLEKGTIGHPTASDKRESSWLFAYTVKDSIVLQTKTAKFGDNANVTMKQNFR